MDTSNQSRQQKNSPPANSQTWLIVILVCSVLSIGFHAYLATQHYKLHLGLADAQSICNVNQTFNCDSVATSTYSSLMGVPMATWGAATHTILSIIVLILIFSLSQNPMRLRRYMFVLTGFIFATSVAMAIISSGILKVYCLFCIGAYVLSAVILLAAWKSQQSGWSSELGSDFAALFGESRSFLIFIAAIPLIAMMANWMSIDSMGGAKLSQKVKDSLADWSEAKSFSFDEKNALVFESEAPATMTIVEFADFLCPHCKHAGPGLHAFSHGRKDVKFLYKAFPLDGTCNNDVTHKGDGLRCQLAYSAYCAEKVSKKGMALNMLIFDKQETWSLTNFKQEISGLLQKLEIPQAEFDQCLSSGETHNAILEMAKEGSAAGVRGTPSIFVNGKLLAGGQFIPVLNAAYEKITSGK